MCYDSGRSTDKARDTVSAGRQENVETEWAVWAGVFAERQVCWQILRRYPGASNQEGRGARAEIRDDEA